MRVLVAGAGVIGLTTGIRLIEAGHQVTIRAGQTPGHTSVTAAAMWGPYLAGPEDKVTAWSEQTRRVLTELATEPGTGVRMLAGFDVAEGRQIIPVIDTPSYMDYLVRRLQALGGRIEQATLHSLAGLAQVVINCTGLGSRELAGDSTLTPVRGQLVVLANPGIDQWYLDAPPGATEFVHFLPHGDVVIAGGVAQAGREDLEPDLGVAQGIIERCGLVEPKLKDAAVVGHRVGLRPSRPEVRLEEQLLSGTRIVHNYGHGGAGISLSWGCAADVVHLMG